MSTYIPQAAPPKAKKGRIHWAWLSLAFFVGLFVGVATSGPPTTPTTSAAPQARTTVAPAAPVATQEAAPVQPDLSQGIPSGDWSVPEEVGPGKYRSTGAESGIFEFCQVTTKNAKGNVMEWKTANANEPILVTVDKSAVLFTNSGCEPFVKVG